MKTGTHLGELFLKQTLDIILSSPNGKKYEIKNKEALACLETITRR